jgi:hypothetical protein
MGLDEIRTSKAQFSETIGARGASTLNRYTARQKLGSRAATHK